MHVQEPLMVNVVTTVINVIGHGLLTSHQVPAMLTADARDGMHHSSNEDQR